MGPIEDEIKAQHAAEEALLGWVRTMKTRDQLIRNAAKVGVNQTKIARILHISRSAVNKVVTENFS